MKILLITFSLFFLASSTLAQEPEDPTSPKKGKSFDWKMVVLDGSLRGAAILDTKSTYDTKWRCVGGCVESNPYAAWFINKGPHVAYPAAMVFDTGVTVLAVQMRKSSHPVIRRIWFVPHVALIAGHLMAARGNYKIPQGTTAGLKR